MKKILVASLTAFLLGSAALASPAEARCWWNGYGWHCWHPHARWYHRHYWHPYWHHYAWRGHPYAWHWHPYAWR